MSTSEVANIPLLPFYCSFSLPHNQSSRKPCSPPLEFMSTKHQEHWVSLPFCLPLMIPHCTHTYIMLCSALDRCKRLRQIECIIIIRPPTCSSSGIHSQSFILHICLCVSACCQSLYERRLTLLQQHQQQVMHLEWMKESLFINLLIYWTRKCNAINVVE